MTSDSGLSSSDFLNMKHINKLSTKSYFIDRTGKLSASFMFYQMQDIAWEHANILGFGFDKLRKEQQFWVLSRLLVKINRRPDWGENFTLETWSRGTDGFYGYRDFNFVDGAGKIIAQATSSWLVLDAETKRIVRLTEFTDFPKYEESVFGANAEKLKVPQSDAELQFTPVLFNEIDINQHFNTGRYIERIIDSYDFDFHANHELAEYEINFLKEGMPTDRLAVKTGKTNELNHLCSVVRESDGAELIRARLVWRKTEKQY
jgi:acyl-ACP thioesterase